MSLIEKIKNDAPFYSLVIFLGIGFAGIIGYIIYSFFV